MNCTYFEVCGLSAGPIPVKAGQNAYCILHDPNTARKDIADFRRTVEQHLAAGKSDFRCVQFPDGDPDPNVMKGRHFTSLADFRDVVFKGTLNLEGATFEGGLSIAPVNVGSVSLYGATVKRICRIRGGALHRLVLTRATFECDVEVEAQSVGLEASSARFGGGVSLLVKRLPVMFLDDAVFAAGMVFHGTSESDRQLVRATFAGTVNWSDCVFNGDMKLNDTTFDPDAVLILDNSVIRGLLIVDGSATRHPEEIRVDGTQVTLAVVLKARIGYPAMRVVARSAAPQFGGEKVRLENVDLRECCILGNALAHFEFTNVEWPQRFGRCILFEETLLRDKEDVPLANLKEAYQILKQRYQSAGDNRRAGDFHYGEMEVQRRQVGWPRRVLSWEGAYWALNGYGTGDARAFAILVGMILVFGGLYWFLSPEAFARRSLVEAVRHSFSVATLQRPEIPWGFGAAGKWLQGLETVLGPIQIALFVFALRMRVKR